MMKYRLKSRLYSSEFDKPAEKKKGLSLGQTLGLAATSFLAVKGYKAAGAGKFGTRAQNTVNSFRMNTSRPGSQRFNDAQKAIEKNRRLESMRIQRYGTSMGQTQAQIDAAKRNLNNNYAGYGSNNLFAGSYFNNNQR